MRKIIIGLLSAAFAVSLTVGPAIADPPEGKGPGHNNGQPCPEDSHNADNPPPCGKPSEEPAVCAPDGAITMPVNGVNDMVIRPISAELADGVCGLLAALNDNLMI